MYKIYRRSIGNGGKVVTADFIAGPGTPSVSLFLPFLVEHPAYEMCTVYTEKGATYLLGSQFTFEELQNHVNGPLLHVRLLIANATILH